MLCLSLCQDIDNQLLGPVSTRNLLLCFLWVLKNIDKTFLNQWWFTLSIGRYCIHSLIHSLTHSFTHSLVHSLTHSLTQSFTHSLVHSFTHSLVHPLTRSPTHSFTYSLTHSIIHSLTRSLIHTLTHSHIRSLFPFFLRLNTMLNVLELCVACFEYRVSSSPYQHV